MPSRSRDSVSSDEGFTLIELLVVIIIIGILAGIAIPIFLNQRQKGYDAQARSDLRNLATAEETYLANNQSYAGAMAQLTGDGSTFKPSANATTSIVGISAAAGFCLKSVSNSSKIYYYSSTGGGFTSTPCTNQ